DPGLTFNCYDHPETCVPRMKLAALTLDGHLDLNWDPEMIGDHAALVSPKAGARPSCCIRDRRFATPQWSVILPLRTRMTSTVSKWILRPVGANSQNVPSCVPWYVLYVVTRSPSEICQWISA